MSASDSIPRYRNLQIGERFERLVVVGPYEIRVSGGKARAKKYYYPCRCKCGNEKHVESNNLLIGLVKSCGCLRDDTSRALNLRHGKSKTALYAVWNGIISRCENPNSDAYGRYGERGITMCREWRDDFAAFHTWAIANGYRKGLSVERKDNDLGYCPSNCILATPTTQARNRRSSSLLTAWGETKTAVEWTEDPRCNASQGLIHWRVKTGIDHQTAISTPPDSGRRLKR